MEVQHRQQAGSGGRPAPARGRPQRPGWQGGCRPRRMIRLAAAGIGAGAALLAAACEGSPPDAAAPPSPPPTTATAAGPLPQAFPTPPDVTGSTDLFNGTDRYHVQLEVASSYGETVGFLEEQLPAAGWEVLSRREAESTTRYRIEGHGWTGAVTVFGGDDQVAVLVQLGPPEETASP